jgi:tryptophanyl-tRNA synthetase
VALQDDYECVYCIVDIHALTTMDDTSEIQSNSYDMMLDWLAAGLDPEKSILFVQSHVPEVMQLHTLLSMVTPLGWLLRVPTFKEKVKLQPENVNYGLVGYPVLMTSDIVLYKAEVVPVGEDQLPHLELAREIARRFNYGFGDTFPEPQAKLTEFPMVIGLDGKEKMSKQLDNHIELALSEKETEKRVMTAVTDPARKYRHDPGHPEVCNVYKLQEYFNSLEKSGIKSVALPKSAVLSVKNSWLRRLIPPFALLESAGHSWPKTPDILPMFWLTVPGEPRLSPRRP